MTIFMGIAVGLIISIIIVYFVLNLDKFKTKKQYEHQDLIDKIHSRIAKSNGASIEQFTLESSYEIQKKQKNELYKNAEFINKDCNNIDDFVITDEINAFDLRKLADLNGIDLQISEMWYPLVLELIKELNANGWNKKVSCIKEKYAKLRFSTSDEYQGTIYNIIKKYEDKSEYICETCGARGEIRRNTSWDYVACRKHYLQNRGKISNENLGFNHNGISYQWKDVKNVQLEDFDDYYEKYSFLMIEFNQKKIKHQGWNDEKLYISSNSIGFGDFLSFLFNQKKDSNLYYSELNRNYLKHFENPNFCEICGYKSVYLEECECCENKTWASYNKNWNDEKLNNQEKKNNHIKLYQIWWVEDEGEIYENQQNNYSKNPEYKLLFTNAEYEEYANRE